MIFRRLSIASLSFALLFAGSTTAAVPAEERGPSKASPPDTSAAEYDRGLATMQRGDLPEAEGHFRNVLRVSPGDPQVLFLLGIVEAGQGDLLAARDAYAASLAIEPRRVAARAELAATLGKLGESGEASADLDLLRAQADACADTCPEAADLRAAFATAEAAIAPRTTVYLPPLNLLLGGQALGDPSFTQALRLMNAGEYDEALKLFWRARSIFGPGPDVMNNISYIYIKTHRYDEAETYLIQALAAKPTNLGALEYYGELKVARGDRAGARRTLVELEHDCSFGCIESEDLRRWIEEGPSPQP